MKSGYNAGLANYGRMYNVIQVNCSILVKIVTLTIKNEIFGIYFQHNQVGLVVSVTAFKVPSHAGG